MYTTRAKKLIYPKRSDFSFVHGLNRQATIVPHNSGTVSALAALATSQGKIMSIVWAPEPWSSAPFACIQILKAEQVRLYIPRFCLHAVALLGKRLTRRRTCSEKGFFYSIHHLFRHCDLKLLVECTTLDDHALAAPQVHALDINYVLPTMGMTGTEPKKEPFGLDLSAG
jgi:hypothetical protein